MGQLIALELEWVYSTVVVHVIETFTFHEIVSFTFTPYQLAYHIHYHHSVTLSLNTNLFHKSFFFLPYHQILLQMFHIRTFLTP